MTGNFTGQLGTRFSYLKNVVLGAQGTQNPTANNALSFSQTAVGICKRPTSNSLAFTQTAVGIDIRPTSNALTFSQTATLVIIHKITQSFVISQSLTVGVILAEFPTQTVTFSQTAIGKIPDQKAHETISFVQAAVSANVIARSLAHSMTFVQVLSNRKTHPVNQSLTFTQSATENKTVGTTESLTFTESATLSWNHSDYPLNTLVFSQAIKIGFFPKPSQTITFIQSATVKKIKAASASNLFVVTALATTSKILHPNNSIVFVGTATATKTVFPSVAQTITFTTTARYAATFARSLSQTLVFPPVYLKQSQVGGLQIPIPWAVASKISNYVLLQVPQLGVILPRPILGDTEGGVGTVAVKRAMNGATYTYVHSNDNGKLKYEFQITRSKAFELRNFVQNYLTNVITLSNWKGEVWIGHITNNPFEFVAKSRWAPCSEEYDVTIEFEGLRVH